VVADLVLLLEDGWGPRGGANDRNERDRVVTEEFTVVTGWNMRVCATVRGALDRRRANMAKAFKPFSKMSL